MDLFSELQAGSTALPMMGFTFFALLYAFYLVGLPRPLPGIPYNKPSSRRLLGDFKLMKSSKYIQRWIWSQPREHDAPLSQVFLTPFGRPLVIVTDYREVVDICSRRLKEFDRGTRGKKMIKLTAPNFHIGLQSSDPEFKFHKELLRDLMTPKFLNEVSAPRVYDRVAALVDLWDLKTNKAHGRPFPAHRDLSLATLDMICSVAFGMEDAKTALRSEFDHVQSLSPGVSPVSDEPVDFTPGPTNPEIEALIDIPEMIAIAQKSPFPVLAQWLALLKPKHARAQWHRRALIKRQTGKSLQRLVSTGPSGFESALDQLLWREMNAAKKADRPPDYYSPVIRDEILGYVLGGHDTSSAVSSWWVKYMTGYQSVQTRLRNDLRQAHRDAHQEGRWPTIEEICGREIPFLEAVMQESLRCAAIAGFTVRTSTCDTQVLGYPIPRGTVILLPLAGPSMTEPALQIPETSRTPGCLNAKDRVPYWGEDIHQFKPERWLKPVRNPDGTESEVFDQHAGPALAFSVGPRQCFGKRLAYIQLRTIMTLLMWNFEFAAVDESLNGSEIIECLVNLPKDCYVNLKRL